MDSQAHLSAIKQYLSAKNETIVRHYVKNKRAYLRQTFFPRFYRILLTAELLILIPVILSLSFDYSASFNYTAFYILSAFIAASFASYLIRLSVKLWFWKYCKDIFLTKKGVWIVRLGLFWTKNNYFGKKKMFSPYWESIRWEEILHISKGSYYGNLLDGNAVEFTDRKTGEKYLLQNAYLQNRIKTMDIGYFKETETDEIVKYSKHMKKLIKKINQHSDDLNVYGDEI